MQTFKYIIVALLSIILIISIEVFLLNSFRNENNSPIVFSATRSSMFGNDDQLVLYEDRNFLLQFPAITYKGSYRVEDNIVFLNHEKIYTDHNPISAFIIEPDTSKIRALDITENPYKILNDKTWMNISINNF